MGAESGLLAYVDETGDLGWGPNANRIFAMSAVVVDAEHESVVRATLASMRDTLGLPAKTPLQWKQLRQHEKRLFVADTIGGMPVTILQVCMFKDHLTGMNRSAEALYLYSFRYLVERLSWLAKRNGTLVRIRLAQHKVAGEQSIKQYLAKVKAKPNENEVEWDYLEPDRVFVHRPDQYEMLQLADLTAGPIHSALVPTSLGYLIDDYLLRISPRIWRPYGKAYPSYGFKVFPGPAASKLASLEAAFPVLTLLG
ncbi:MAG: DUF3800 domain-containing protein [Actinobacteria bacterium]|nr:DUF3800 domain-containing protein [Actinomycetota bacterium]MBU1492943.1 DUF3800 domain-containing protein [Actinomycetota bacterium]